MVKKFMAAVVLVMSIMMFTSTAFADYYTNYTTLRYGMRSSEVVNLQNDLKSLGYFTYTSTGYFGSITESAVRKYQRNNGLTVDGIVGHNTAREIKVDKVLQMAKSFQGVPYAWGGVSPSGFDCSGFTHYVLLKNGIVIPRMAADQYYTGSWVQKSQLKPGDLVFFTTYKVGPSHVGFYLGNNKFIHASSSKGVTISDLSSSYYAQRYIGAKRVIK